ncbi:VOC family protein [Streptomyces albofaciens JCM 4342]|uniref:bleomycin resistance protein n=1 Tax=Streptomyces albofaciens TaxID=66866 RepID=UPI001239FA49|nr:VOC family protein [Streptomyces albofaciens]KAA6214790.1 VOC family protein [Streptomyces albofaciens JCM 4342]
MAETVIPMLPCPSIDGLLDFYRALGFEVTSYQKTPNPYCGVRLRGIELQFFGMKSYDPTTSYSTCYVLTDDVDGLHASFRAGLKAAYGKVPTRGLPRIGALKDMPYGVRQFLMTDPGGNCIRIGQPIADSFEYPAVPKERYARALHQATLLGESKGDHAAAARIIDRALEDDATPTGPTAPQLFQLLVLRAETAAQLDGLPAAVPWLDRADAVELDGVEDEPVRDARRRAAELRDGAG